MTGLRPDTGRQAGTMLIVFGVVLLVSSLVVSAALAPSVGAAGNDETPQTLVGSQGGGPGLHESGSVYLLDGKETKWKAAETDSYFDVTMLDNGSVATGFMDSGYEDCEPYESPCTHTGFRILEPTDDGGAEIVYEYSFPVRTRSNSEVHDVELLDSGEFLVSDMEYERIFTVKNGEVTWQWNASSMYDAPADPTTTDWLHINDVDALSEDRYLVSVRNANQLVVIERGEGVVEVINKDENGDGTGDPEVLLQQHNPQWLNNGSVLVADSHNDRIVELHRNNTTDEWEVAWAVYEAEGVPFSWPRDADRLANGNTLITDSLNQRVVEVNESGMTVWSYKTPYVPYEAERLPEGETVGATTYATNADATMYGNGDVPVLSLLLILFQTGIQVPFWFTELHVGVTLVSLAMTIAGTVLIVRDR
ncbi:hypothetical protein GL213_02965 [Halogeometricum borinquense]|uniref:Arylsulfotransferase (ASST) n=1 Tax=Halogeometricum borinquense TaxID=60847 RepID=A0A6C0UK02_9EURY|nr:arylsulfotransferase family protein [Halogeometricum borinquense]QIB75832.1 hypothetical protein G3I44_17045 [Halogeometricum borinquense]QIQ75585.1 hypothetical protein GL213_02965 [Halogeometricum borinquense]